MNNRWLRFRRVLVLVGHALFRRYELDEFIVGGAKSSSGIRPTINPHASAADRADGDLNRLRSYLATL